MNQAGNVESLSISDRKGVRKRPVPSAVFVADHGIQDDAHAGAWHRQVSLLASQDIAQVRRRLKDLQPGDFAENVAVADMDLSGLGLGSRLRLGKDVELSVTQIGKVCHTPCQIYHLTGDCIMPRLGLFARVLTGGTVQTGDPLSVLRQVPRSVFQAVVLTISDRCSRGQGEDTAGPAVARQLEQTLGAHIYRQEILPDEQAIIAERLQHYCDGHSIDLVVTAGGTGFSPRDVTPEATRGVVERLTPGLDEAMRASSIRATPRGMLSRGVSGIRGSTLIVNLPGSQRAAVENISTILPTLSHGLVKLRGDKGDCGRQETRPIEGAAP